jgi:hypothetical protein
MTVPTRVAGWGELADGSIVTWTVAEGRQGRRWREVVARDGATVHALLFETDPDGRFSHLELARADGLWTFHPEVDGTLHGNHVAPGGTGDPVRHVKGWPFAAGDALLVEGSPIADAALLWPRSASIAVGAAAEVAGVAIRADGRLERVAAVRIERATATTWRVGHGPLFEVDEVGLPVLAGGGRRPLEDP